MRPFPSVELPFLAFIIIRYKSHLYPANLGDVNLQLMAAYSDVKNVSNKTITIQQNVRTATKVLGRRILERPEPETFSVRGPVLEQTLARHKGSRFSLQHFKGSKMEASLSTDQDGPML